MPARFWQASSEERLAALGEVLLNFSQPADLVIWLEQNIQKKP
jgi:hypothetical protein